MIDNLLLEEVKLPNKKSVYEIIKQKHSHLLCIKCSSVVDIDIELNNIKEEIPKNLNFTIKNSDLVISGICQDCK
jgi:Fur family peroxide stress response transcriptional regulator